MKKSVYMINGFLESGKTEFIRYTLQQPYFQIPEKTLLIQCEEGEIEIDEKLRKQSRTVVEVIEDEEDFTIDALSYLERKHKPERIIIEYNGMWNFRNMKLPDNWEIEQQITTINAATFPMYYTNMKSLLAEMLKGSEMIIFNRCDGVKELGTYKRNVKAINQSAEIIFEDSNGEINEIMEEDLPYDLKQDTLELTDFGYGIWYMDTFDHPERYLDKTLVFTASVLKPPAFPKGYFVPGRMAMTCCAEDMTFLGFICEYNGADALKEKTWVKVRCTMTMEVRPEYRGKGPVLHAISVEPTAAPKKEIIDFMEDPA